MGHVFVTGSKSLTLSQTTSRTSRICITSIIVTPLSEVAISAHFTLYDATAATANTEIVDIRCGTAPRTIVWSDPTGLDVRGNILYAACASAFATIVWS